MSRFFCQCLLLLVTGAAWAAPVRIATLHPIASDLIRQVGGEVVEVVDLMPVDANPHAFYPSPSELRRASESALIVAMGKGLETYLDGLRESLGGQVPMFELGRGVPSLRVEVDEVFLCCPAHARGAIDPHWWHSVRNMRRAAFLMAERLAELAPEHAAHFHREADRYAAELDGLYRWARSEIGGIPRRNRKVTTSHAAFGYLCREFGLRSITVLGLTTEQEPEPGYLKDVLRTLIQHRVPAVFPEKTANPRVLESLAREAGVKIAAGLYADNLPPYDPTYMAMMRHNITTLVEALGGGR